MSEYPNVLPFPLVVMQALDDKRLRPSERLAMWDVWRLLNFHGFVVVKGLALASLMNVEERTAVAALQQLSRLGYLEVEYIDRRTRAYRLPLARQAQRAA